MELSERDKRMLLRGMSLARAVVRQTTGCEHQVSILAYQNDLADSWGLKASPEETNDYIGVVRAINEALESKHPDWMSHNQVKAEFLKRFTGPNGVCRSCGRQPNPNASAPERALWYARHHHGELGQ